MSAAEDWRTGLLSGATPVDVPRAARNPAAWPGYEPRQAVSVWRLPRGPVAAVWDFGTYGGSFGEDDATALAAAARLAVAERRPLLTLVRSGGTRLQEGMAALVGIPRARIALQDLAAAQLPHLSVADAPTTGGVWISVTAAADLRVAVAGATVAFAGPRVVEAFTGVLPPTGAHTAESACAAGLVDAVLPAAEVADWLDRALTALAPPELTASPPSRNVRPSRAEPRTGSADATAGESGWDQVLKARARTRAGADLLAELLAGPVALRAPRGDDSVAAAVGRIDGRPVVGVTVAARVGGRPTPDGYRLAARAYRLAARLALPVVSLVDTPGADPGPVAEDGGVAGAMGEALDALLTCPSPTLALVHGEGGSGGALAAAAADRLLVTPEAYFAAIGPEGAEAALRRPRQECADLMRVTPADLLGLGVADALVSSEVPAELTADVARHLAELSAVPASDRYLRRRERWASPVPHGL